MKKFDPKDFLMWNGMDIELFLQSHDAMCVHTLLQFLQAVNTNTWEPRAITALQHLIDKYQIGIRVRFETKRKRYKEIIQEPPVLKNIAGVCPKCSSPLLGEFTSSCMKNHTGRHFVKICTNCTYYAEVFVKDNIVTEIEGE